ncbi:MAG: cytochrome c [Chloroflexi bacterium]|nr:cytochrome c [Chloroflexota bacterium]
MRYLTLSLIIMFSLILLACGGTATTPPAPPAPPAPVTPPAPPAVDAKQIYAAKCAACHGPTRQGVTGLAPALTAQSLAEDSDADIKAIISNGKTGTAMVAFKDVLKADEIDAIVKFLKSP